jgi:hypothetical protein
MQGNYDSFNIYRNWLLFWKKRKVAIDVEKAIVGGYSSWWDYFTAIPNNGSIAKRPLWGIDLSFDKLVLDIN